VCVVAGIVTDQSLQRSLGSRPSTADGSAAAPAGGVLAPTAASPESNAPLTFSASAIGVPSPKNADTISRATSHARDSVSSVHSAEPYEPPAPPRSPELVDPAIVCALPAANSGNDTRYAFALYDSSQPLVRA